MKRRYLIIIWTLLLLSAILLSLPFLVPGCGVLALIAFVPLLCAERVMSHLNLRLIWLRLYVCFVIWNALTTFWVCNATVGGGIAAIVINAAEMTVVFCLFRMVKKGFKGALSYIFLAVAWIAWERAYYYVDISWPWLTLGNAFARTLPLVQWYSVTGTLGGSLWVWLCNLAGFGMMVALSTDRWKYLFNVKAKAASVAGLALVFLAPAAYSLYLWFTPGAESEGSIEALVIQPNIDPYHKFEALSQRQQNDILLTMMSENLTPEDSVEGILVLAPETFTGDIVTNDISQSPSWQTYTAFLSEHPGVELLFGASSYDYIESGDRPSLTARRLGGDLWYESHNSALLVDGKGRTEIFHKSRLVVAVEQMPYPRVFAPIDRKLGGVMGHCIGQDGITLLHYRDSIPLGCAICYESVYGDYCRGYIQKGAKALTVITNDAWWGDTPGYRQHLSYSSLRAIETHRAIARCANTGISGFIDAKGRIVESGPWWKKTAMRFSVPLYSDITPFVRYGDMVGNICRLLFWMLLAAGIVKILIRK